MILNYVYTDETEGDTDTEKHVGGIKIRTGRDLQK